MTLININNSSNLLSKGFITKTLPKLKHTLNIFQKIFEILSLSANSNLVFKTNQIKSLLEIFFKLQLQ